MENEPQFLISQSFAQVTINYLQQRPYAEVAQMIAAFTQLTPLESFVKDRLSQSASPMPDDVSVVTREAATTNGNEPKGAAQAMASAARKHENA